MHMTDFAEDFVAAMCFDNTAAPAFPTLYITLDTTAATLDDASDAVELSGGGYARQPVTAGAGWTISAASGGVVTVENAGTIDFNLADDPTIQGMRIMDAVSGGNALFYQAVSDGPVMRFLPGQIRITFTFTTDLIALAVANHIFGGTAFTPPANIDVVFYSTLPQTDGSGGVEIAGTTTDVTGVWDMPAAGDGLIANNTLINMLQASSFPATAVGVGILNNSGGAVHWRGLLNSPLALQASQVCRFQVGDLVWSVA